MFEVCSIPSVAIDFASRELLLAGLVIFALLGVAVLISELVFHQTDLNLRRRYITALLLSFGGASVTCVGGVLFSVMVLLVLWGCTFELHRLQQQDQQSRYFAAVAYLCVLICVGVASYSSALFQLLPVICVITVVCLPIILGQFNGLTKAQAITIFGIFCFGWLPSHIVLLRNLPDSSSGLGYTLLFFLCVIANDSFSFIVGKSIGCMPLSPRISPHKTVEGFIGGFAGAFLAGLVGRDLVPSLTLSEVCILCFMTAVLAPIGDLCVSGLKRDAGVKDSGKLFPGHGGFLDRFGSYVLCAPIFYYFVCAFDAKRWLTLCP